MYNYKIQNIFLLLVFLFLNSYLIRAQTGPELYAGQSLSIHQNHCSDSQPFLDNWFFEIENFYFTTDCLNGNSILTFSNNCNACEINCNETLIVTYTVEDECGISNNFDFTFTMDDGDGIPVSNDNCPDHYNPGQEDFDGDGIGNVCDTANVPGNSVEVENNLYLNALSSGVILKDQDGKCWFITVETDGQTRTYSVDCP